MYELTVVLPTYNEAGNLPALVHRIERLGLNSEIIVVDDGSKDGTAEVARALMIEYGNIKLIEREGKQGIDTAVRDAAAVASADYIAVMDSDLQHPPEMLPVMLGEARSGKDIVVASRYVTGSANRMGLMRRLVSRAATSAVHFLVPQAKNIRDPLSGFFLFYRKAVSLEEATHGSYKILLEIIARNRVSAVEVPFSFGERYSGKSKLGLTEMIRFASLTFRLSDYRAAKFITVGLVGIAINEGILFMLEPHAPLLLASAVAVEASIVSNFIMNNTWTFRRKAKVGFFRGLVKYNFVTIVGGIINILILGMLVFAHFEYLAANFIGTLFGFAANYLGSEGIVWHVRLPN